MPALHRDIMSDIWRAHTCQTWENPDELGRRSLLSSAPGRCCETRLACCSDASALFDGLSEKPELRNLRPLLGRTGSALQTGEMALLKHGVRVS